MIALVLSLASVAVSFAALFLPQLGQAMGTSFLLFGCAFYGELHEPPTSALVFVTLMCVLANFLLIPRNGDFARLNFFGVAFVLFQGYWTFWFSPHAKFSGRLFWPFLVGGLLAVFVDVWNSAYWADSAWVSRRQGGWCAFNFVRGYSALLTIKHPDKRNAVVAFLIETICLIVSVAAFAWTQSVAIAATMALDLVSATYAFTEWKMMQCIDVAV